MQRCSVPNCESSSGEVVPLYACVGAQDNSKSALFCQTHFTAFQVKLENIAVVPVPSLSTTPTVNVVKEGPTNVADLSLRPIIIKPKPQTGFQRPLRPKPPKLTPAPIAGSTSPTSTVQDVFCEPKLEDLAEPSPSSRHSPYFEEVVVDVSTEAVDVKSEWEAKEEAENLVMNETQSLRETTGDRIPSRTPTHLRLVKKGYATVAAEEEDISRLCRLCAEAKTDVMPIYGEMGAKFNLAAKISQHLPIRVSRRDKLPLIVCSECANTFMAYQDLVANCRKADKKLKRLLKEKETAPKAKIPEVLLTCSEEFNESDVGDNNFEVNEESADRNESPKAAESKEDGSDSDDNILADYLKTRKMASSVKKEFSECPYCKCNFRSVDLAVHNLECEGRDKAPIEKCAPTKLRSKRPRKKKESVDSEVLMKLLGVTLQEPPLILTEKDLVNTTGRALLGLPELEDKSQRYSLTPAGYMCNKCLIKYNEKEKILKHLRRECSLKIYQCRECGFRYRSMRDWKRHSIVHKKDRDYKCSECEMCFTSKSSLKHHLISHDQNHRVLCDECGANFKRVGSLQRHLAKKHGKVPDPQANKTYIRCQLCPAKFQTEARLGVHMNQHMSMSPFVCEKCGHTFASVIGLKIHQTRNACQKGSSGEKIKDCMKKAEKKEICVLCLKRFQYPHQLHFHHKVTHQNVRAYHCQQCPKSFLWAGSLRKHLKHHSGERLACNYCSKSFMHRNNLVAHLRIHTGERPYTCSECGKKIMTFYEMKRHKLLSHGEGKLDPPKQVSSP